MLYSIVPVHGSANDIALSQLQGFDDRVGLLTGGLNCNGCVSDFLSSECDTCLCRSPGKVKLTGMQKKGFKSDWLGHAKREDLDESALNTTKTSKVCK